MAKNITYLGESACLPMLVGNLSDNFETHVPQHFDLSQLSQAEVQKRHGLSSIEFSELTRQGAFLLPERQICDRLIDVYFEVVNPQNPVVDKVNFMKDWTSPDRDPPILLLQVMLLAASRKSRVLEEFKGEASNTDFTSLKFLRRARALLDANFEKNSVVVVQAFLLLSWSPASGGLTEIDEPMWYWTGLAIRGAQSLGMHRSLEGMTLIDTKEKKIWKRIWWCCRLHDCYLSFILGRPSGIQDTEWDVSMPDISDFLTDADDVTQGSSTSSPLDKLRASFFVQLIRLAIIASTRELQYVLTPKERSQIPSSLDVHESRAFAMRQWYTNLPPELLLGSKAEIPQNFRLWIETLHMIYHTLLLIVHRSHLISVRSIVMQHTRDALQATMIEGANAITSIIESAMLSDRLQDRPFASLSTYSVFAAMLAHSAIVVDSGESSQALQANENFLTCLKFLSKMAPYWPGPKFMAQFFYEIFKSTEKRFELSKAFWGNARRISNLGGDLKGDFTGVFSHSVVAKPPRRLDLRDWCEYLQLDIREIDTQARARYSEHS